MDCTQYREALSARLDGEPLTLSAGALENHVSTCIACQSWLRAAERITRLARIAPADEVPDLSAGILAGVPAGAPHRPRQPVLLALARSLLAVLGIAQAGLAYPFLVFGQDSMDSPIHVAHETGAWNGALAVAFLWVALRPRAGAGLLPMLSAFVAILFMVSVPDLLGGHAATGRVAAHLLTAAGLAILALMVRYQPVPGQPYLGGRGAYQARAGGGGTPDRGADWSGRGRALPGPVTGELARGRSKGNVA